MKTSTLLMLGGAVALTYYLVKRKTASDAAVSGPAQGIAVSALSAQSPPLIAVDETVVEPMEYYVPVGWGPSWGGYRGAWGGRRRGRGGGHGPRRGRR